MDNTDLANAIRSRYPLAAAVLDLGRCPTSSRYQRFVVALDSQRVRRRIPAVVEGQVAL
jgi:hypothetical protein